MKLENIFNGYSERISSLSSYFFITSFVLNRNKFKEFSNEEFFNLTIQFLLYIFHKCINRETCLKEDLSSMLEEIIIKVYKKKLDSKELDELTAYFINGLTNNGKVYDFTYYNFDKQKNDVYTVQLITTTGIKLPNGNYVLKYELTIEGYRLLLATKEYDDLIQMQTSQIIAKIRIEKGDYSGAKQEINKILNSLFIECKKIDNYIKNIRNDIFYIKKESYVKIFRNALDILVEEIEKYDELKLFIQNLIVDKEALIDKNSDDNIKKINKELNLLKELIQNINTIRNQTNELMMRIQNFRKEYDDILFNVLKNTMVSKFNFKEVILDKVESENLDLNNLSELYKGLFLPKLNNLFYIDAPYKEQKVNSDKEKKIINDDWDEINEEEKERKQKELETIEEYYYYVVKKIMEYFLKKETFTLKEFLNFYLINNKTEYKQITANCFLFRNIFLNLVNIKEFSISKIKNDLSKIVFSQTKEFQIERLIERLLHDSSNNDYNNLSISIIQSDEFITINTEINEINNETRQITMPNIIFKSINDKKNTTL